MTSKGRRRVSIAIFCLSALIAAGSILVWAGGEDVGFVVVLVSFAFGGGVLGAVLNSSWAVTLAGAAQAVGASIFAVLVATDAPTSWVNISVLIGAAISFFAGIAAASGRSRSSGTMMS